MAPKTEAQFFKLKPAVSLFGRLLYVSLFFRRNSGCGGLNSENNPVI
jgi:hypothetical protein